MSGRAAQSKRGARSREGETQRRRCGSRDDADPGVGVELLPAGDSCRTDRPRARPFASERHATRVERAAIGGGCKAQPDRSHQCIRRARPGDDRGQSTPSKAIAGKASLHEDGRHQDTRHTEPQRHDVPRVQAGRNGQPRDHARAGPDRYRSEATHSPFQIGRVAGSGPAGWRERRRWSICYRGAAHSIPKDVPPTLFGTPDPGARRNPTRS
jgi:hypothetical protein